jgi:hypothetical protein
MKLITAKYDVSAEINGEQYIVDDRSEQIWYKNEWHTLYDDQNGCWYFFADQSTIYPKLLLNACKS